MNVVEAGQVLGDGGVVLVPTDTVWGVAASIESIKGIEKLYRVKNREDGKPTAVLVSDREMAWMYGEYNDKADELMEKHWPGGLTVVVGAKETLVPEIILGNTSSVGLRAPDNRAIQELLAEIGVGIVASSANFAGEHPARNRSELDPKLVELVDGMLEGEAGGLEPSTVVEVKSGNMQTLRKGSVKVG